MKKTSRIVAVCGLICNDCRAYIATQKNDGRLKQEVADAWSTETERLALTDIDCDGCQVGKRLHSFCSVCEVRKCGMGKCIANCGHCAEYPCEKLEALWKGFRTVSGEKARVTLNGVRSPSSNTP